eukprot:GHVU01131414.1.p1 GENE.GHVU01131414.1~~GHVU01131414.1.p1  ORF type:complete len:132 (-),score=1.56 GHVU01131414.1:1859-2254(-)
MREVKLEVASRPQAVDWSFHKMSEESKPYLPVRLPTSQSLYLHVSLRTSMPTRLPVSSPCLPVCLLACVRVCLPPSLSPCMPTCLPVSFVSSRRIRIYVSMDDPSSYLGWGPTRSATAASASVPLASHALQ